MARYLTRGMVVLADDHPGTGSALFAAREYTPRTIVVSPAGLAEVPTAQMVHPRGGASIDAAFRCAADDMIPWVAMRRDYAPPEAILSQVLEATGRRARNDLPGFCVLLAGAEPRPIGRILTVLDRADGQPSGLLILAAVATAQATGADLDVLLMGAPGESMSTPANVQDAVRVSRDKDLYDQAIRRATEAGHPGHLDRRGGSRRPAGAGPGTSGRGQLRPGHRGPGIGQPGRPDRARGHASRGLSPRTGRRRSSAPCSSRPTCRW